MKQSVYASKLDEIESRLEPFFRRRNFKHRKRAFWKRKDDGIVHLVEFGMAASYSKDYGKFTVDIAIFIPEVYEALFETESPKRISTTHCELVKRLPSFQEGIDDKWWEATEVNEAASEISGLMIQFGFPFLERMPNRKAIIKEWKIAGEYIGLSPRAGLVMAIVFHKLGDGNSAKQLIDKEISNSIQESEYPSFVSSVATKLGIIANG